MGWAGATHLLPCFPKRPLGLQMPKKYSSQPSSSISLIVKPCLCTSSASFSRSLRRLRSSSSSPEFKFFFTPTASAIFSRLLSIASKPLTILDSTSSIFRSMRLSKVSLISRMPLSNSSSRWWTFFSSIDSFCEAKSQITNITAKFSLYS